MTKQLKAIYNSPRNSVNSNIILILSVNLCIMPTNRSIVLSQGPKDECRSNCGSNSHNRNSRFPSQQQSCSN